ncbi:MAG: histidine kinase [Eubacteriales bacterium]|nr:histidine kinase [Eubacteriales bacterium]
MERKGIWGKIKPNTLAKKCACAICIVTAIMLLAAGSRMSDWIYHFLEPKMQQDFTVLNSAVVTKISYLLHQNTQYLLKLWKNDLLISDIVQYIEDGEEKEELKKEIEEYLVGEYRGREEPGAILSSRNVIAVADWDQMFCQPEMEKYGEMIMESPWFENLKENLSSTPTYEHDRLKRTYSPVFPENEERGTQEFISLAMLKETEDHQIVFLMTEPFEEFRNIFSDFLNADVKDFCMIGKDGEILFQNMEDSAFCDMKPEEIENLFAEEQYKTNLTEIGGNTIIGVRTSYQIEQMKLVTCLSKSDFLHPYESFVAMIHGIFIAFQLILLILIILILNRSLSKLNRLASQMRGVKGEVSDIPKSIKSDDEVGMIADTFYQMMDQIRENIEKIKEQEQKEKKVEYSLLVSQIDPHFIYNTLNTITYLADLNQTEDIMIINKALIGMLRDRLKMTKLQIYDTLEREKQQLDAYMTIQKYLCSNEISMEFPIQAQYAKVNYPKNVLQPFVENAILHGIVLHRDENGRLIPGKIWIDFSISDQRMITKIQDNGIGMSQEKIQKYFYDLPSGREEEGEIDMREHIGIYNIRMRMKYLYGEQFQIDARQRKEGGLEIILKFPAQQEK